MSAVLLPGPEFTPPDIVRSIEEHLRGTFGGLRVRDSTVRGLPELNAVFSPSYSPEQAVGSVRRDLSGPSPADWWWVGPGTRPRDLSRTLLSFGLVLDHRRRGVAVNISAAAQATRAPSGTLFQEVRDATETRHVADLWSRAGSAAAQAAAPRFENLLEEEWNGAQRGVHFALAWSNSRPVAVVGVRLSGTTAGVFGLTTLGEARRKGIARALLAYALRRAGSRGARWAVAAIRLDEESFYRSFGFATYDDFEVYRSTPLALESSPRGV